MNYPEPHAIHVRGPLQRVTATFQPAEPHSRPVTEGTLIRVGGPLIRGKLTFRPVLFLKLRLTLPADADSNTRDKVAAKVTELVDAVNAYDDANGGTGFVVRAQAGAGTERVVELELRPNDMTNAESRLVKVAALLKAAGPGGATLTGAMYSASEPDQPLFDLAP